MMSPMRAGSDGRPSLHTSGGLVPPPCPMVRRGMGSVGVDAGRQVRAALEVPIVLPKLYRKQAAAVCDPTRITCIESTTKAGKTIGCIVWQIGQVMSGPEDAEHWWVAPVYEQAMMAYRLAWSLLRGQQGFKQALAEKAILCPGGRRWSFRSADKPDNLFGSAVTSAVLDEASRMKDDAVDAIFSTTTRTRGPMRLIGNVRGRANRHYQWSRKGEAGEEGFAYHRITADDAVAAGVFHADDVEMARRSMPDAIFRELYYCEPADDGGNPFGIEAIRSCAELNGGKATGRPVAVWGLDIARKRDWAVLIGLDHGRQVAALHRWHGLSFGGLVGEVSRIVGKGSRACVVYDATGVGDAVGEQLVAARVWVEPFIFSSASKQGIMEGLALALQQGRTSVVDGPHRAELEAFEYDVKAGRVVYGAPSAMHDDTVCAHALAWWGAERFGVTNAVRRGIISAPSGPAARGSTW